MSSSKNQGRKDKGKAVQEAEDYQLQVPTKNQFQPLSNFPPLPYKTIVSLPPPSPGENNSYVPRHVEQVQIHSEHQCHSFHYSKNLWHQTLQLTIFVAPNKFFFYELILVETKSIIIYSYS